MERDSNLADKFRRGNLDGLYDEMYRPLLLYATKCLTDRFSFLAEDSEGFIRYCPRTEIIPLHGCSWEGR